MKRRGVIGGLLILAGLCALAPYSSQSPDAVQKIVGLPGGAEPFVKAVSGVLVVTAAVLLLGEILRRFKS